MNKQFFAIGVVLMALVIITTRLGGKAPTAILDDNQQHVGLAVFLHKGYYYTNFAAHDAGIFDQLALTATQAQKFSSVMKFKVHLIAMLDNTTQHYRPTLQKFGWNCVTVALGASYEDVQNPEFARLLVTDGAIGIHEMTKLEAWKRSTFAELDVPNLEMVAMIDTDVHFRQPFDALYEAPFFPDTASFAFTHGPPGKERLNAGVLVVRLGEESEEHYDNIMGIFKRGRYTVEKGWRNDNPNLPIVGFINGGGTLQGILPHYYLDDERGKGRAKRNPPCQFNNMLFLPQCITPEALAGTIAIHFTGGCPKPWKCLRKGRQNSVNCRHYHAEWFEQMNSMAEQYQIKKVAKCNRRDYISLGIWPPQGADS